MIPKFNEPLFMLRLASIVICIIGLTRIFAIILPFTVVATTFHVEGSNIFIELTRSFNLYLGAAQESLGIENKAEVLYLFTFSFFVSLFFIVSGIFSFLRKSWARKTLFSLIALDILSNFAIMFLRGKFTIHFIAIDLLIFYIFLMVFFTRQPIVRLFTKDA